ncbi:hypothetical protein BC827DRAFT_1378216 [Russula dissimulans]|nr:hypothetical protein BC827DRAFT_1378216 [Russula dissimulans]
MRMGMGMNARRVTKGRKKRRKAKGADEEEEGEEPTNRDGTQCRRCTAHTIVHDALALVAAQDHAQATHTHGGQEWTQKPSRAHGAVHKDKDKDLDSDIESEDDDEGDDPRDGVGKRPLTTRQAALASVVLSRFAGCVHVPHFFSSAHPVVGSIDETSRKKKRLNEAEIALRREETARKRKHLSDKELEDEKVREDDQKKLSGTRNRRDQLASAEDRAPATYTGSSTPVEGEVDEEESREVATVLVVEVVLTCYQWISTLKPSLDAPPGDKTLLSFSVPVPTPLLSVPHRPVLDGDGGAIE